MTAGRTATPMAPPTSDTPTTDAMSAPRLSERTLASASADVLRPNYERANTRIGIVHFGPGAFHRAHQAFYFDRLLEKDASRAVCAVSLKTPGVRDALAPQDGLYTLMELDGAPTVRIIGAIRATLVATEDSSAVSRRLCAPETSLITMTVTEKGYCLDGAGKLDFEHPDIAHDLRNPDTPRSLVGWIVRGLRLRHERGEAPYLVVCCDNLSNNGQTLRSAVLALAARQGSGLADWIEKRAHFPRTMVDSITPATDDAFRSRVAQSLGLYDAWPIQRERFVQWVVEETDSPNQPDWSSVGVTLSRDVSAYERAKLRLLNGAHSTLAYVGMLAGLETVADAMAQPALRAFVERLMRADIQPTLDIPRSGEMDHYRQSILRRFENPAMRHQLAQIAWDGSQKLPIRILGTVADAIRAQRPLGGLAVPIAAWMHFIRARTAAAIPIVDPLCDLLVACGQRATGHAREDLPMFLALPGIFPGDLASHPEFMQALSSAYDLIAQRGPLASLAMHDTR